jgi:O-acetylserine/cysteine efflux transporter
MRKKDLFLALLVVIIWGSTFTVIKLGLVGMPPMVLVGLRFTVAAFPAVFLIKKPEIPWKYIVAYGLTAGLGQFAFDIYSLYLGMPAGLASVIMQSNVFLTFIFAFIILKDKIDGKEILGLIIATIGIILLSLNVGLGEIVTVPPVSLFLQLMAAGFWAISSIVVKKAARAAKKEKKKLDVFGLVVWSSMIPIIPFFIFGMLLDSPEVVYRAIIGLDLNYILIIIYLSYAATLFGFSIWGRLLRAYDAGKVALLSLLVPVSGLLIGWVVMGEVLSSVQIIGVITVILGLLVAYYGVPKIKLERTKN